MGKKLDLWSGIDLPAWNLEDFHTLFLRVRQPGPSKFDVDRFTKYLMLLISLRMTKKWIAIFSMNHIEPSEAASLILCGLGLKAKGLYAKALTMRLHRIDVPEVVITAFNSTIHRDLTSVWRKYNRKTTLRPVNELSSFERPDTRYAAPGVDGLAVALRAAKAKICGDCPDANRIYPSLVKGIVAGNHLPSFDQITRTNHGTISNDVHTSLVYKLNCFVREFAQDLTASAV